MKRGHRPTPDRILAAAFEEFTRRGFAGARVDRIAARAKVNKALIYRHFGSKERLFKQILECKMAEVARLDRDPGRFSEAVGGFFDFYAANPRLVRLMLWEALDFGAGSVPGEAERRRGLGELVSTVEEAQRVGAVDPALDARQTLVTLMGIIVFWFAAPQAARLIAGGNPYSPESLGRRRAHVVDVARRMTEVRSVAVR